MEGINARIAAIFEGGAAASKAPSSANDGAAASAPPSQQTQPHPQPHPQQKAASLAQLNPPAECPPQQSQQQAPQPESNTQPQHPLVSRGVAHPTTPSSRAQVVSEAAIGRQPAVPVMWTHTQPGAPHQHQRLRELVAATMPGNAPAGTPRLEIPPIATPTAAPVAAVRTAARLDGQTDDNAGGEDSSETESDEGFFVQRCCAAAEAAGLVSSRAPRDGQTTRPKKSGRGSKAAEVQAEDGLDERVGAPPQQRTPKTAAMATPKGGTTHIQAPLPARAEADAALLAAWRQTPCGPEVTKKKGQQHQQITDGGDGDDTPKAAAPVPAARSLAKGRDRFESLPPPTRPSGVHAEELETLTVAQVATLLSRPSTLALLMGKHVTQRSAAICAWFTLAERVLLWALIPPHKPKSGADEKEGPGDTAPGAAARSDRGEHHDIFSVSEIAARLSTTTSGGSGVTRALGQNGGIDPKLASLSASEVKKAHASLKGRGYTVGSIEQSNLDVPCISLTMEGRKVTRLCSRGENAAREELLRQVVSDPDGATAVKLASARALLAASSFGGGKGGKRTRQTQQARAAAVGTAEPPAPSTTARSRGGAKKGSRPSARNKRTSAEESARAALAMLGDAVEVLESSDRGERPSAPREEPMVALARIAESPASDWLARMRAPATQMMVQGQQLQAPKHRALPGDGASPSASVPQTKSAATATDLATLVRAKYELRLRARAEALAASPYDPQRSIEWDEFQREHAEQFRKDAVDTTARSLLPSSSKSAAASGAGPSCSFAVRAAAALAIADATASAAEGSPRDKLFGRRPSKEEAKAHQHRLDLCIERVWSAEREREREETTAATALMSVRMDTSDAGRLVSARAGGQSRAAPGKATTRKRGAARSRDESAPEGRRASEEESRPKRQKKTGKSPATEKASAGKDPAPSATQVTTRGQHTAARTAARKSVPRAAQRAGPQAILQPIAPTAPAVPVTGARTMTRRARKAIAALAAAAGSSALQREGDDTAIVTRRATASEAQAMVDAAVARTQHSPRDGMHVPFESDSGGAHLAMAGFRTRMMNSYLNRHANAYSRYAQPGLLGETRTASWHHRIDPQRGALSTTLTRLTAPLPLHRTLGRFCPSRGADCPRRSNTCATR